MRIIIFFLGVLCTLTLTQCTSFDFARRVAQQGNLLPKTRVNQLKIGMSKNDVAIILGNSLLSPTFNDDRWDYAYTWRKGHGPILINTVTLYFSNGALNRIQRSAPRNQQNTKSAPSRSQQRP